VRWQSFVQWNKKAKVFHDDDIVGFGDTDEIPSRENVSEQQWSSHTVVALETSLSASTRSSPARATREPCRCRSGIARQAS
jgi:hypothetical protein